MNKITYVTQISLKATFYKKRNA